MRYIDIDGVDPGYPTEPAIRYTKNRNLSHRQLVEMRRTTYVHLYNQGRWDCRLGIKPETMRDWRGLERRMSELNSAWLVANDAFWEIARSFPRPEDGVSVVVIDDPKTGDDGVLTIYEDGYSTDTKHRLLEDFLTNRGREDKFTLTPFDQGGKELGRLYYRMNRLLRSCGAYKMAFQRSVDDRINRMREDKMRHVASSGRTHYLPCTFIVENEGRVYVVTSSGSGQNIFHEGEVYTTMLYDRLRMQDQT